MAAKVAAMEASRALLPLGLLSIQQNQIKTKTFFFKAVLTRDGGRIQFRIASAERQLMRTCALRHDNGFGWQNAITSNKDKIRQLRIEKDEKIWTYSSSAIFCLISSSSEGICQHDSLVVMLW